MSMSDIFKGNFTQQEPIPEEGIAAAMAVMRSGRLHRYNLGPDEEGEAAALEREFAAAMGVPYCLAVASGGYALACALRAIGVRAGEPVLTNAFTLAPVPGSIASIGAVPVFVEVTQALTLDIDDVVVKAKATGAKVLMLSHMRGHLCDMDRLMAVCNDLGVKVIEDCAHTMGARWNGRLSGTDGLIGCYSTQTYKHMNSGEGGLLVTRDPEVMARAVMLSGSYMLYGKHTASPGAEAFETVRYETPNVSGRMDHLRAAILRPQLRALEAQCERWNERYRVVEAGVRGTPGLTVVERPAQEHYVGSSIQFLLLDWPGEQVREVLARCLARGVDMKWFGADEPVAFTSRYDSWHYVDAARMPKSDRILAGIVDMRLPLTFSLEDCAQIAGIIRAEVGAVYQAKA
jgi:dTDP-4-amino-4,6-dideoxygalactose transaminase